MNYKLIALKLNKRCNQIQSLTELDLPAMVGKMFTMCVSLSDSNWLEKFMSDIQYSKFCSIVG